jgi:hypothetical protein
LNLVSALYQAKMSDAVLYPEVVGGFLMPRFYFHLTSKDSRIPDESGKELNTLNDAYVYARNLIDKILFHAGYDDAEAWKVVISNDSYEAQMIVPFPMSHSHRAHLQSESNN